MIASRAVLIAAAASFIFATGLAAQDVCPDMPYPGPENITAYVSKGSNVCEPGGYVRTGVSYKADFLTNVVGFCDIFVYDAPTSSCVLYETVRRGIGGSFIQDPAVAGWVAVTPNPNNSPQQLDTRASGTSTPDNPAWTFHYEGERTLRFRSNINVTSCDLQPNVVVTEVTFKAVKCVPDWERTSQNQILHHDQTEIMVRVPTSMNARMKIGISNAVKAWNDALDAYGSGVGPHIRTLNPTQPVEDHTVLTPGSATSI